MTHRNKKQVLGELVESAEARRMYHEYFAPKHRPDHELNASLVGKLVTELSDDDKELLKDLTAEDILTGLKAHYRPEKPVTRKRGPVVLSKRKEQ